MEIHKSKEFFICFFEISTYKKRGLKNPLNEI